MSTTQVYPISNNVLATNFASWNGIGSPSLPFVQNVNPYLHASSYDGQVGIGQPAGDGLGPPYTLDNPLPNTVRYTLGDQVWSRAGLTTYAAVPSSGIITFLQVIGSFAGNTDDTWRLVFHTNAGTFYAAPTDGSGNPLSPVPPAWNGVFATTLTTNPATGLAWTRADLFATEFGYEILTSAIAGTVATGIRFYPFYAGNPFNNRRYSWFETSDLGPNGQGAFYVLVNTVNGAAITGSGGLAVSADLAAGGGGGFDLHGLQLQIGGGFSGGGPPAGGGGTGVSNPEVGCVAALSNGIDTGGGSGCTSTLPSGSDSGGGSGCAVSL